MARSDIRARAQAGRLLAAAILCATGAPAAAEVRVKEAAGGRLVIEAHDATVQQILDALGPSRPIRFAASDALSRHVTGTYIGTLPRVLSRILEGYDYVIRSSSSGIKIDVVGAAPFGGSTPAAANSLIVSKAPVAVVRTPIPLVQTPLPTTAQTAPRLSSNVDLDEENARSNPVRGPQIVNFASESPPAFGPPRGAVNAQHTSAPPVSSNLDLDEEMSR
jgi:hypothetical protein